MSSPLDEALKKGLEAEAKAISFSETQRNRVLNNIHSQNNRRKITKMRRGKKILVAVAAFAVISTITVIGAGKVIGYRSSINTDQIDYNNAQEVRQAEDKLGAVPKVPQQFTNGVTFDAGYFMMVDGEDENGNVLVSYPEVSVTYNEEIFLSIRPIGTEATNEELPAEVSRQSGGINLNAYATDFLFLPPDASPSEEDLALEKAGRLQIGYGSPEEERNTFRHVTWNDAGLNYLLSTFNENYGLEELLDMAEDVLAVE